MTSLQFDTNILLYSISRDPTETTKHDRAVALIAAAATRSRYRCCRSSTFRRPRRPDPLPHDIAVGLIRTWLRFKVQEISVPIMTGASEIRAAHRLSYWDAAIVLSYWDAAIVAAARARVPGILFRRHEPLQSSIHSDELCHELRSTMQTFVRRRFVCFMDLPQSDYATLLSIPNPLSTVK
jgi:predicted nucleic acid-binding protein